MIARDVFGVIVRTVGFLCALYGFWCVGFGAMAYMGYVVPDYQIRDYFNGGMFQVVTGLVVLRAAEAIVRFTYRPGGNPDSN